MKVARASADDGRVLSIFPMTNLYRIAVHEAAHCVACIVYGIPIWSVTIDGSNPHMHQGAWQPPDGLDALECLCTMGLVASEAEKVFCDGKPVEGSDRDDVDSVLRALAQYYSPLEINVQLERMRGAAERLVKTDWARRVIPRIADELLRHGSLTGEQIAGLVG